MLSKYVPADYWIINYGGYKTGNCFSWISWIQHLFGMSNIAEHHTIILWFVDCWNRREYIMLVKLLPVICDYFSARYIFVHANALQLEVARRRAVPLRFNFVARAKFEVAHPICCRLRAFLLLIRYVTLRPWTLTPWPWPLTFTLNICSLPAVP